MATVRVYEKNAVLSEPSAITECLVGCGIGYEQWTPEQAVEPGASAEAILRAYAREIDRLKAEGGYVTADVIDIQRETPGLDAMLAKFNQEHWHDEDEVRFIIRGHGLFHIRPRSGPVVAIEVETGDLLRVPQGTWHWFDLCADREIRAIRLFQDPSGWTPRYTASGADRNFQPLCFGPTFVPGPSVSG